LVIFHWIFRCIFMNQKLHLWDFSWIFHGDSIFHRLGRYWIYGVIIGFLKIFEEIFPLIIQRYGPFSTAMLECRRVYHGLIQIYIGFVLNIGFICFCLGICPPLSSNMATVAGKSFQTLAFTLH
jgi:hypothetical protein